LRQKYVIPHGDQFTWNLKTVLPREGTMRMGMLPSTSCVDDKEHYVFDFCSYISKASDMLFDCCFAMSVQQRV